MTHGKGMFKWFGVADEDLTPLPAKAALPAALSGDMTFASGSELEFDAENGAVVSPVAVTGQLKFENGAKIVVKGFDDEVKAGMPSRRCLGTVSVPLGRVD